MGNTYALTCTSFFRSFGATFLPARVRVDPDAAVRHTMFLEMLRIQNVPAHKARVDDVYEPGAAPCHSPILPLLLRFFPTISVPVRV
jgi:hypothetical protein